MPPPISPGAPVRADLDRLAEVIESIGFALPGPDRERRLVERDRTLHLARRLLDPRLTASPPPLTVAVFGGTGSGKSTLVNSLAGRVVSPAGVLRPTTADPMVWRSPGSPAPLPWLEVAEVVDDHPVTAALTIVDTPDVDSHLERHRAVTAGILDTVDVAVLVTTPQRYADASPRDLLRRLEERGALVLHVVNRMRRGTSGTVADYASSLGADGVAPSGGQAGILRIREQRLRNGLLPGPAVAPLRRRLVALAGDPGPVRARVVDGGVAAVAAGCERLAREVEDEHGEGSRLVESARAVYRDVTASLAGDVADGSMVRQEVVERWRRQVGVSDLATVVGGAAGRVASRVREWAGGGRDRAARVVQGEARHELAGRLAAAADRAAAESATRWAADPRGAVLLEPALWRADPDTAGLAADAVGEWIDSLGPRVAEAAGGRFRIARYASVGVNLGATLLLLTLLGAGGLTGAEVGVVAGAAAAQQTILEHLLGSATAGRLARAASADLDRAMAGVMDRDADRFRRKVEEVIDPLERADHLRTAAEALAGSVGGGRG